MMKVKLYFIPVLARGSLDYETDPSLSLLGKVSHLLPPPRASIVKPPQTVPFWGQKKGLHVLGAIFCFAELKTLCMEVNFAEFKCEQEVPWTMKHILVSLFLAKSAIFFLRPGPQVSNHHKRDRFFFGAKRKDFLF